MIASRFANLHHGRIATTGGLLVLAALAAFALAAPSPSHAQATQVGQQDALTRAASSVGIKRCLPAVSRLSALGVQGSRSHDVLLDWDRKNPDGGPMFSLIGLEFPNAGAALMVTAIPEAATDTCTVAAERVSIAPFTCASVAQQELANHQMTRLLPTYAVYTDPKEPGSSVSLIDSPPGCLIIRRFVEYHWKDPAAAASAKPAAPPAPARR